MSGRAIKAPVTQIHGFAIKIFFLSRLSDNIPAAMPEIMPIIERLSAFSCENITFYAGKFFKKKIGT